MFAIKKDDSENGLMTFSVSNVNNPNTNDKTNEIFKISKYLISPFFDIGFLNKPLTTNLFINSISNNLNILNNQLKNFSDKFSKMPKR